jgi:AraC-like DNA-binding protein
VLQGHGSIGRGPQPAAPMADWWSRTIPNLGKAAAATDQSVAGLHRLDRAEQQAALAGSVLGRSLHDLAGNNISVRTSVSQFGKSLNDLGSRAKFSKAGIDGVSDASKTNRAYMLQGMYAAEQHTASLIKSGKSAEYVRGALLHDVSALEKTALHAGFSKRSFEGLLKTMGLTPKQINTVMLTKTERARAEIRDLQAKINAIKQNRTPHLYADGSSARDAIASLQARIDALHGKTVDVYINQHTLATQGRPAGNTGAHIGPYTGGYITGPGTGTSDSIPAMLSNGEYVINARQTSKHRALLKSINSGAEGFASGGQVGRTVAGVKYTTATGAANAQTRTDKAITTAAAAFAKAAALVTESAADLRGSALSLYTAAKNAGASSTQLLAMSKADSALYSMQAKLVTARTRLAAMGTYRDSIQGTLRGSFDPTKYGSVGDLVSGLGGATSTNKAYSSELNKLRGEAKGNNTLTQFINQLASSGQTATLQTLAGASRSQLAQVTKSMAGYNQSIYSGGAAATGAKFGQTIASEQSTVNTLASHQHELSVAIGRLATALSGHTEHRIDTAIADLEHVLRYGRVG